MKPSIGRIVHFVQRKPAQYQSGDGSIELVHLPAVVTAVWSDTCVNLQVFTDGTKSDEANMSPAKWVTSVSLEQTATIERTWHWPERD